MILKMNKHLYDGSWIQQTPCKRCGMPARHSLHFQNGGGDACDMWRGPCACGAFHDERDHPGEEP